MSYPIDEVAAEAKTGRGTRKVPYEVLVQLADIAFRNKYVMRTVHGFELRDGRQYMRSDASYHYAHRHDAPRWNDTVQAAFNFAHVVLDEVPDKEKLIYEVWFDDSGSI